MATPLSAYSPQAGRPRTDWRSARTSAATDQAANRISGESVVIKAFSQFIGISQYSSTAHAARVRSTGLQAHQMAQPTPRGRSSIGTRMAQAASPHRARAPMIHQATMGGWS